MGERRTLGFVAAPILHLSLPVRDLEEARVFYTEVLGCDPGRVRDDWLDVWFFGMQLTLQCRPSECLTFSEQGVRHFGVAINDRRAFDELIRRVGRHDVQWLAKVERHESAELSAKTSIRIADPSGNVIEIKYYEDSTAILPSASE
jgi:uncharacterized protein